MVGPSPANIKSALRNNPLFTDLTDIQLAALADEVWLEQIPAGSIIVREDEEADALYVVVEGGVNVTKANGQFLAFLGPGGFFGEMALLDESPRSASSVALETSHILVLYRPEFFDILERKPKLGLKVMTKLAQIIGNRLRIANTELQSLCAKFHKPGKLSEMVCEDTLLPGLDTDGGGRPGGDAELLPIFTGFNTKHGWLRRRNIFLT